MDSAETELLNIGKLDNIIEVYRLLTEKHRNVTEYYGVHIVCNVSIMLLSVLLTAYFCWIQFLSNKGSVDNYYVLTKVIIDLVNIAIISSIGESADVQVRNKGFTK